MVKLFSAGATHVGLVRTNNEDAYLAMPEAGLFALSDGMGGAAAGEVASKYFVETVEQIFTDDVSASEEANVALVRKVFKSSNKRIIEHTVKHPDDEGMGCTGELLVVHEKSYVIGHVGDSRVYLVRDEHLRQLTRDQSLVQGLVDEGILTPEEARHHPRKNIILQALGTDPSVTPDVIKGEAFNHDIFLLCSVGLTDMVDDCAIRDTLVSKKSLDDKAESLIEAALAAGGKDNVTVVLCEVEIKD
ncbi:MAG TPA: Stp1/IreP family PP2C-type Ser/Thr phosphatase [Nitrosospira sp.]